MLTRRSQVSIHDPSNEYLNKRFLNKNIIPVKVSFETNKTNYSSWKTYMIIYLFRSTSYNIYRHCVLNVIGIIIPVLKLKTFKCDYAYMFHLQRIFIVWNEINDNRLFCIVCLFFPIAIFQMPIKQQCFYKERE